MNTTPAIGCVLLLTRRRGLQDVLTRYFAESFVRCELMAELNPRSLPSDSVRALIILPDDFRQEEVSTYLAVVRDRRPDLLTIVVTQSLASYENVVAMAGRPVGTTVYASPSFGWTTLDAVRTLLGQA